jgi:hypothetical protein
MPVRATQCKRGWLHGIAMMNEGTMTPFASKPDVLHLTNRSNPCTASRIFGENFESSPKILETTLRQISKNKA